MDRAFARRTGKAEGDSRVELPRGVVDREKKPRGKAPVLVYAPPGDDDRDRREHDREMDTSGKSTFTGFDRPLARAWKGATLWIGTVD